MESRDLILEILQLLDKDYIPLRNFKGPIFLSGFGLWVDYKENSKLNENIDQIMLMLEGNMSIFDISQELHMDFNDVLQFVNKLNKNKLIKKEDVF